MLNFLVKFLIPFYLYVRKYVNHHVSRNETSADRARVTLCSRHTSSCTFSNLFLCTLIFLNTNVFPATINKTWNSRWPPRSSHGPPIYRHCKRKLMQEHFIFFEKAPKFHVSTPILNAELSSYPMITESKVERATMFCLAYLIYGGSLHIWEKTIQSPHGILYPVWNDAD